MIAYREGVGVLDVGGYDPTSVLPEIVNRKIRPPERFTKPLGDVHDGGLDPLDPDLQGVVGGRAQTQPPGMVVLPVLEALGPGGKCIPVGGFPDRAVEIGL